MKYKKFIYRHSSKQLVIQFKYYNCGYCVEKEVIIGKDYQIQYYYDKIGYRQHVVVFSRDTITKDNHCSFDKDLDLILI